MAFKFGFLNPLKLKEKFKLKKRKKLDKKKVTKILTYSLLAVLFLTSVAFAWFAKDLPTPDKISKMKPAQSTKIYDRNGVLLYETGELKRTLVPSDQVPQNIKNATVAVEDQSFYQNHGLNFKGIARAALRDILHIGTGKMQGGSTITQQYVKNALLYSDQTIVRKIKEVILAIELEFMYSKDQILTMYLNEIPYGGQTAGVEAASRMYYGKSAKDLTLAQAATLAAIPQAPTYYSPYGTHTERLVIRRNYVLDQMVKMKYITSEEAEAAKKEDTTTVGTTVQPRRMSLLAPHFSLYVLEQAAEEYGETRVEKEGLTIYTTLDYEKQKVAEQAVTAGISKIQKYGGTNAALVASDPKTGEVLSMVGSRDFFDPEIDGNVNVSTSLRQPGSSFKPYVYATAFKKKEYSPSFILYDFTTDFGNGYIPNNYDGKSHGPVTMRQALANSLNIPAVKTTALAGIDEVINTASDLGISTLTDKDRYGLSLGLGVAEVSLLEHTGGFGVFANGGNKHDVKVMRKVVDNKGKVLYEYKPEEDKGKQVLDPQIAYQMQSIMSDNNARAMVFGTRTPLYFPDRAVGVKTGTTNDFKDAWTVGYTPSLAVGVWTGNNDSKPMSRGADGSIIAAPIFHDFMAKMTAGTPAESFNPPEGVQSLPVEKWSNKLPSEHSRETTTDIFASWQIPTEKDDVNVPVKVCKNNGLRAPDGTPDTLTEIRVFTNIRSEMPKNPNWENPVRTWAASAGMINPEPAGTCDIGPSVSITTTTPSADQTMSGTAAVSAVVNIPADTDRIEFFIDGTSIGTDNSAPFSVSYNFSSLNSGRHVLKVVAYGRNGTTDTKEISFFSIQEFKISSVASSSVTEISAKITWITNTTGTSEVYYGTSANDDYNSYDDSKNDSNMVTSHSVILSGLTTNTTYHYRVVSTDGSGKTIFSTDYTFKTL